MQRVLNPSPDHGRGPWPQLASTSPTRQQRLLQGPGWGAARLIDVEPILESTALVEEQCSLIAAFLFGSIAAACSACCAVPVGIKGAEERVAHRMQHIPWARAGDQ